MSKLSRKRFKSGNSTQQPVPPQQQGRGEGPGPSTRFPISDTHGHFTQQSPVSDTYGPFTQQSSSRQRRGTTSQASSHALRLKNVGNSCFANSALQLLYSVREFREFIITKRFKDFSGENICILSLCLSLSSSAMQMTFVQLWTNYYYFFSLSLSTQCVLTQSSASPSALVTFCTLSRFTCLTKCLTKIEWKWFTETDRLKLTDLNNSGRQSLTDQKWPLLID